MLTITDKGLSAIRDAEAGGFLLNAVRFQLGETALAATDTTAEALVGDVVFEGAISAIEAIGMSSVKLTCQIPTSFPKDGSKKVFRQIGIFLDDGTMFAYGALVPAYDKEGTFGIKIYVVITADRLSAVLNLTISELNSLSVIPHVRMLPDPIEAETNAVIVLDEQDDVFAPGHSSSIAIKNGGALNRWAFLGFNKVYRGPIDFISKSSFHIDEKSNGFWINDKEIVIVLISSGTGNVHTRKMKYNKESNIYTVVDKEFDNLDATSVVEIWRNTGQQLPERREDIPSYYMLKHATKSTTVRKGSGTSGSYYELVHAGGPAGGSFTAPGISGVPASRIFVYADGKELSTTEYTLAGTTVTAPGSKIDVYALVEKTPPSNDVGYYMGKYESTIVADGYSTRFFCSIVPKDGNWIMVFIDGVFIHSSDYDVEPTAIVFRSAPDEGKQVYVVCLANYVSDEQSTSVLHINKKVTELTNEIEVLGLDVANKQNVFLFVNNKYVKNNDFHLVDNTHISWTGAAKAGEVVDVYAFNRVERVPDVIEGLDTGPMWDDPAGVDREPNKIVPVFVSHVGDGNNARYSVPAVNSATDLLVFVDGVAQSPASYMYDAGASKIILSQNLPANQPLDVIAIQEQPDTGKEYKCYSKVLYPTSGSPVGSVVVPTNVIPDSICVFYDSAYIHRDGGWTFNNTTRTITFSQVATDKDIEIWGITELPHPGWYTQLVYDMGVVKTNNPLSRDPKYLENILMFIGGSYQLHPTYSYVSSNPNQPAFANLPGADLPNVPYFTASLTSGKPLTRLVLRSELIREYYNKGEVDALVDGVQSSIKNENYISKQEANDLFLTQDEGDARYELKGKAATTWNGLVTWDNSQLRLVHHSGVESVARIDVGRWRVVLRNPDNLNIVPTANAFHYNTINTGADDGPPLISVMVEVQSSTTFVLHAMTMGAGSHGYSQIGKYVDPSRILFNVMSNGVAAVAPPLVLTKPAVVIGQRGQSYPYAQFVASNGGSRVNATALTFQYSVSGGLPAIGQGGYVWSYTSSSDADIISIDSTGKLFINGDRNHWIDITVYVGDGTTTLSDQVRVNMWW